MEQQLAGRIKKELEEIVKDTTSGITITQTNQDSLKTFLGVLPGPKDTVYEGGLWRVDINLPKNYPFEPPKMKFITPLWHPNVSSQTGAICLDILKDGNNGAWSPALTMRTVLMSLQALMCAPEPKDPQDAQVARQYMDDRKAWERQARHWTQTYAGTGESAGVNGGEAGPQLVSVASLTAGGSGGGGGSGSGSGVGGAGSGGSGGRAAPSPLPIGTPPQMIEGVKTIMEMGFSGEKALEALKSTRGNVQAALERLM